MAIVTFEIEDPPIPDVDLVDTDGEPMDSSWHRDAMWFLIESIRYQFRHRRDFHVGGNNFIYFDKEEAHKQDFKGPDFFYVKGVRYDPLRRFWVVWQEEGKFPNVITELLSPSTAKADLTTKKAVYERIFRTPEYFCYDPATEKLQGWRLDGLSYMPLQLNEKGWLWSAELELWLGTWIGEYQGSNSTWLRFYEREGKLVPIGCEAEAQRAIDALRQGQVEADQAAEAKLRAQAEAVRAAEAQQQVQAEALRAAAAQQQAQAEALRAAAAQQQAQAESQRADEIQRQLDAAKSEILRLQGMVSKKNGSVD